MNINIFVHEGSFSGCLNQQFVISFFYLFFQFRSHIFKSLIACTCPTSYRIPMPFLLIVLSDIQEDCFRIRLTNHQSLSSPEEYDYLSSTTEDGEKLDPTHAQTRKSKIMQTAYTNSMN